MKRLEARIKESRPESVNLSWRLTRRMETAGNMASNSNTDSDNRAAVFSKKYSLKDRKEEGSRIMKWESRRPIIRRLWCRAWPGG
jgi:methylthioribose-1-phosphate isomerase